MLSLWMRATEGDQLPLIKIIDSMLTALLRHDARGRFVNVFVHRIWWINTVITSPEYDKCFF